MNYSDPRIIPRVNENFQPHTSTTVAKVLDHGFVKIHNISGPTRRPMCGFDADDTDPANTARMSFENMDMNRTREMDLKLCNYLMENIHSTPFEMIEIWLEMKLPIFVARQFVRHRTCTINEVSARYVKLPEEYYIPEVVGKAPEKGGAKQGQTMGLMPQVAEQFKEWLAAQCKDSYMKYSTFLEQKVAPEHARMFLHLNHYTHWMWKQDLHNMMHFLSLRAESHAQVEAQAYANAIIKLLEFHLPYSMELFWKHRFRGVRPTEEPKLEINSLNIEDVSGEHPDPDPALTETFNPLPVPEVLQQFKQACRDGSQSIAEIAVARTMKADELVAATMTLDEVFPTTTAPTPPRPPFQCPTGPDVPIYPEIVTALKKPGIQIISDMMPDAADLLHMAVGLMGETVELMEAVKAGDDAGIMEEFGDAEFFLEGLRQCYTKIALFDIEWTPAPAPRLNSDFIGALISEAHEILDVVKRVAIYGSINKIHDLPQRLHNFKWQLDEVYLRLGKSRDYAIDGNMYKLVYGPKARYAGGKYSNAAAIARVDKT